MSVQVTLEANVYPQAELIGRWDLRLARWISDLLCPPVVAAVCILVAAAYLATPVAWKWAALFLGLAVVPPTLYVIWLLHRGEVSDFHLCVRHERIKPMLVTVAAALSAWGMLIVGSAPRLLVALATVGIVMAVITLVITLRWKISGHTTAISSLAMLCCILIGPAAAPIALSVPLVAWARVRLHRHTLAQTLAGAALGTLTSLAFYLARPIR